MARHELQDVIDELPVHFKDAMRLSLLVDNSLRIMTETRRANGKTGSGAPPAWNSSLNRAVVVAAVGGIEAYMERLAKVALDEMDPRPPSFDWVTIQGGHGDLTTPSPRNIRKLFWTLFRFDLLSAWNLSVAVSNADLGLDGTWRVKRKSHREEEAARFIDSMLQVRHGFAHQDGSKTKTAEGMASVLTNGSVSVQSHHAHNAVSAALQLVIQSTDRVAQELSFGHVKAHWRSGFNDVSSGVGMDYWLADTEAEELIRAGWKGAYPAEEASDGTETDESPIGRLDEIDHDLPSVVTPDDEE